MSQNGMTLYGDWDKLQRTLDSLSSNLTTIGKIQVDKDGKEIYRRLIGHIEKQDLNWRPLSPYTVQLKHGNTTIYVDTGFLKANLKAIRVREENTKLVFFIGASSETVRPDGVPLDEVLVALEYGRDRIPARPLIRPTWEEAKSLVTANWKTLFSKLLSGEYNG